MATPGAKQLHVGQEVDDRLQGYGEADQCERYRNDDQRQGPVEHEITLGLVGKNHPEGALQGFDQAARGQQQGEQADAAGGDGGLLRNHPEGGELRQLELVIQRGQQHARQGGRFR